MRRRISDDIKYGFIVLWNMCGLGNSMEFVCRKDDITPQPYLWKPLKLDHHGIETVLNYCKPFSSVSSISNEYEMN